VKDWIAKIGAQRADRDGEEGRDEQGGPSPAAKKARQAVLDATRGDSISDSQTYPKFRGGEAAEACILAAEKAGSSNAAGGRQRGLREFAPDHRSKRKLDTEREAEDSPPRSIEAGDIESAQPDQ
jgi:hypothetical protein